MHLRFKYKADTITTTTAKQLGDWHSAAAMRRSSLLAPRILALDLLLLLRREVVLNVEPNANLLGCLALNLVRNGLASQVKQRLDIQVVGRQDQVEEGLVINLDKVLVPNGLLVLGKALLLRLVVVLAVLDHLDQDLRVHHRQRHWRVQTSVVDHVLHGDRSARNPLLDLENLLLLGLQLDRRGLSIIRHGYVLASVGLTLRQGQTCKRQTSAMLRPRVSRARSRDGVTHALPDARQSHRAAHAPPALAAPSP